MQNLFGEEMELGFIRPFTFVSVSVGKMMFTPLTGILRTKRSAAMGTVTLTVIAFCNIIDVDESIAFIQRKGQKGTQG